MLPVVGGGMGASTGLGVVVQDKEPNYTHIIDNQNLCYDQNNPSW